MLLLADIGILQSCPAIETSDRAHCPPQQSLSEAARKEKEIVLRSQIEIVKSRQPVWDSSKLLAEIDKVSNGGTFDVAKVLRGFLDRVDSAFVKGDTDLTDNLYWKMIHIAQEHKCKELAKAIADCYRTFLYGIKHRSQPTYSERLEYVDKLLEL